MYLTSVGDGLPVPLITNAFTNHWKNDRIT